MIAFGTLPAQAGRSTVEVRLDGDFFKRISEQSAKFMCARGWGEWRGTGKDRYIALTDAAPISTIGGRSGARISRADNNCRTYRPGQRIGHTWEHA